MENVDSIEVVKQKILEEGYTPQLKNAARFAWWSHCESSKEDHVPTFRQFWNNEETYHNVL